MKVITHHTHRLRKVKGAQSRPVMHVDRKRPFSGPQYCFSSHMGGGSVERTISLRSTLLFSIKGGKMKC
jgi:hypothetical protein